MSSRARSAGWGGLAVKTGDVRVDRHAPPEPGLVELEDVGLPERELSPDRAYAVVIERRPHRSSDDELGCCEASVRAGDDVLDLGPDLRPRVAQLERLENGPLPLDRLWKHRIPRDSGPGAAAHH